MVLELSRFNKTSVNDIMDPGKIIKDFERQFDELFILLKSKYNPKIMTIKQFLVKKDILLRLKDDMDFTENLDWAIKNAFIEGLERVESGEVTVENLDDFKKVVYDILHPPYTRFEKARIIGSRALQISYGAPVLLNEYPDGVIDPIDVALIEFDCSKIPITIEKQ